MIHRFTASNFRCLENVELTLSPGFNLIYGANASGKTSILEALAYLGRGKSFRGAPTTSHVRHGDQAFVQFGETSAGGRHQPGAGDGQDGLAAAAHLDGDLVLAAGGGDQLAEGLIRL